MSGQQHAPATLYPRERTGTHFTRGWVGHRAGLDGRKISSPTGIRSRTVQPVAQSLDRLSYRHTNKKNKNGIKCNNFKVSVYGGGVVVLTVTVNFCCSSTKLEQPKCDIVIKPNCWSRLTKAESSESATEEDVVFLRSLPHMPKSYLTLCTWYIPPHREFCNIV